ncbi:hypothetical protein BB560_005186 [Smittium megazygosporum]|uniref:Uncharacterized protein n=1 Tax=Smittium megazygosporum TaxID=133381 RepID=A0A2T9Z767_9FUNG|nr:hypothetical protein BB560_005186 [Smittium megazygosporum]
MYSYPFLLLSLVLPAAFGATCQNEGATRCSMPNAKGAKYIICENGKEVEKACEGGETCHSNGNTGIMCIDVVNFKKRQANTNSAFGGYEPLINSFNNGMYGDANSFNSFITNMRSMMMTDKNALGDVTGSVSSGVQASKSKIGSNTKDIGSMFKSSDGVNNVISNAKKFQRSLNQNMAGYSNLVSDVAANSKSNAGNLNGVSSLLTSTYTAAASGINNNTGISADEINKAITNMDMAFDMYYPNTLGKLFQGNLDANSIAGNAASSSGGNPNATSYIFRSLIDKTKNGQAFITPFTSAAVKLSDSITTYATPARVTNVINKYRSINPSSSNTVNVMNGVANAALSSRGSYRATIENSYIAYTTDTTGSDCGCGNSDSFSAFLGILASLLVSQMLVPSGGCCYPTSVSIFTRSLSV